MQRIIGGEFDIDISRLGNTADFAVGALYSSGRAALFNILKQIDNTSIRSSIMLPDYLCDSVLDAVSEYEFEIVFYKLNIDLSINKDDFKSKYNTSSVVLLINYFGCIDCTPQVLFIKELDSEVIIIQDNVQAFYAMYSQTGADYYFTSFRKSFAVPDGAWAVSMSGELPKAAQKNTFAEYKIVGGVLKHLSKHDTIEDQQYLNLFREGEKRINNNYSSTISRLTLSLLSASTLPAIAETRKKNAAYIIAGLEQLNIKPILKPLEVHVPLFVPIRLKNRNEVRTALFRENIFCPIHWPVPNGYDLARGKELAGNELSLIVDQRYSEDDMNRILTVLQKYNKQ